MKSYELHIEDDRYSVPTLLFVEATTNGQAKAIATAHLLSSPHHRMVKVYLEDKYLLTVGDQRRAPREGPGSESGRETA
jgi:hypothetical protein